MLKIGTLSLKSNLILAPMAGISDFPYRMLNRSFGCELAFVEMINCRSISYKSKRTQRMLFHSPNDRPLGVQLLGCEEKFILKAVEILNDYKFEVLDFNAACPAKKVVKRGEGASLLKDSEKLTKLLKLIVSHSRAPVTLKIRTGWDKHCLSAPEISLRAQDAGVKAVFIHGRTKLQGYSGSVDYQLIREVKKSVKIPVIASGDVLSAQLAGKMLVETSCDALAIARGALGNPWIFQQINKFLKDGSPPHKPDVDEVIETMIKHLDSSIEFYGEKNGVIIFRKFFSWYSKGFRNIRPLRESASTVKTRDGIVNIIRECRALQTKNPENLRGIL